MTLVPVVFALEMAEYPDESDGIVPAHYAFAMGALTLSFSNTEALQRACEALLEQFKKALQASDVQNMVEFSMFEAMVVEPEGLPRFVVCSALGESDGLLADRVRWTERHLCPVAQAVLGTSSLNLDHFFKHRPDTFDQTRAAWADYCLGGHRDTSLPPEPFLVAFAQLEAQHLWPISGATGLNAGTELSKRRL